MKKLWKISLCLITAIFLLCGCGNSNNTDSVQEATTEASTEIKVDYSDGIDETGHLSDVDDKTIVKLCDYSKIVIPKKEIEPTDDVVDSNLQDLLKDYGVYDEAVKEGDTVNIDYVGKIDGKEFQGGSASGILLEIGSGTFIPGFEEQIIGHVPGEETFDISVTFPKDYSSKEYAGKDAVFTVTLNYILPELTNDFVEENFSEMQGISTVKELTAKVKENIRTNNKNNYIWDYLLANCEVGEIPKKVMDTRLEVSLNLLRQQYSYYMGYGDEEIIDMYQVESMDDVKENLRADTENNVKTYLISGLIADQEGLSADGAAIDKFIGKDNVDEYYDYYGKPYVNAQILISVVSDFIMENAVVK